jgi:hypothetical protein
MVQDFEFVCKDCSLVDYEEMVREMSEEVEE